MTLLTITTSWDDGHPKDLKLAEMLAKHGIGATFYVPRRNSEQRDVMCEQELRALGEHFELGGHTLDHVDLRQLSNFDAKYQIETCKVWLEELTRTKVYGFCYPRGSYTRMHKSMVRAAGFSYGRTVKNLCLRAGSDFFGIPTTIQFYPHKRSVYLRNFVHGGAYRARWVPAVTAWASSGIGDRVKRLAELCITRGSYFHLWGHSWEIEDCGLWKELDSTLSFLSTIAPKPTTNILSLKALSAP